MATIKLKNGSGAPLASDLVQGEPALDLTNKRLYTEDSLGAVIEVGTNPSSLTIGGTALTATSTELNTLDGITATTAELNIMDGVTATALELNVLDGITATTAELNTLDGVTATFAEINTLDGITATTAELNILDGVTATAANLNVLAGTTLTAADLPYFDRSDNTSGWVEDSKVVIADSAGSIEIRDGGTLSWNNNNLVIRNAYNSSSTFDATYPVKFEGEKWTFRQQDFTEMAVFEAGGVDLKKDGTSRLTTTTSGVDVTGTVTADGLTSQAGANATDILTLSGSAAGRTLSVQSYDTTLGGAGFDINASASAGEITLQTNTTDRLRVEATGDISFYEDTGTTAKLTWDASAETLNFADNGKAVFGAGSDLQIYHDGSNSYIDDDGVGNLFLRADNQLVLKSKTQDENYLQAIAGGELRLFHDGVQKLRTEATGIDVTGSLSADGLTVDGTATISEGSSGATAPSDSNTLIVENNGNAGAVILTPDGSSGQLRFGDVTDGSSAFVQYSSTDNLMTVGTSRASGELRFTTGNVGERVRIDSSGNVGIGTSSPDTLLHVEGGGSATSEQLLSLVNAGGAAGAGSRLWLSGTNATTRGTYIEGQARSTGNNHDLIFATSATSASPTERMRIDFNGNVGIGTDTPLTPLTVNNDSNGQTLLGRQGAAQSGKMAWPLVVAQGDGDLGTDQFSSSEVYGFWFQGTGISNPASEELGFRTNSSEAMRIDSSGNVGIGTNSPAAPLHVFNTTATSTSLAEGLTLSNNNATTGHRLPAITWDYGTAGTPTFVAIDASRASGTGGNLLFHTATTAGTLTEAMRIDSSGNLLLGQSSTTTPGIGNTTLGSALLASGLATFSRAGGAANATLYVNKNTDDGPLARFSKDGTSVGTIGTNSGSLFIGSGDTGLNFRGDLDAIYAWGPSGGARADVIDLGYSTVPFKDLYLSGNVSAATTELRGTENVPLELQNSATSGNCRISTQTADYGVVSIGQQASGDFTVYDNVQATTTFQASTDKILTATGGLSGIALGGATAANILDDYEEGTFTPELADAASAGNTATTTTSTGVYTKIGNLVTLNMRFTDIDTTGLTGANTLFVRNMPFTNAALAQNQCEGPARMDVVDVPTGAYSATFASVANSTYGSIRLSIDNSNDVQVKVQDISSGSSDILITITHFV